MDAEQQVTYNLTIITSEGNENPDEATLLVTIVPTPTCDETPYFPMSRYFALVEEESPSGTVVFANLTVMDHDIGGETLTYDIVQVTQIHTTTRERIITTSYPFMLDGNTEVLTLNGEIDREEYSDYEVGVRVVDSCGRSATATVVVTLEDINDHAPTVECSPCLADISEIDEVTTVAYLRITDQDAGENGNVSVQVFENITGVLMPSSIFYLDDLDELKRRIRLDYEQEQIYHLVLNASDHGTPQKYTLFVIDIIVEDFNDNPPVIEPIQPVYRIDENPPIDSEILKLNATDLDSVAEGNGVITFSLPENHGAFQYQHLFRIETNTGRLLVNGILDREQQESLSVLVNVTDKPMNTLVTLSATVVVNITLDDLNDYTPNITFPTGSVVISEELPPNMVAFTVTAVDLDTPPFSNVVFSLVSNSAPFSINPMSGEVTLLSPLDFESIQSYTLQIRASDGTLPSTREVTIVVRDKNDEPPVFEPNPSMPAIEEGQTPEVYVATIAATDPDTPRANLVFTIGSGNELGHFRIDPSTGQIFTITELDKESVDFYNLTIRVYDGRQHAVEDELVIVAVIDINDNVSEFIGEPFRFHIPEGMPRNSRVGRVVARNRDTGSNAIIRYSIVEVNPAVATPWFNLNSISGEITTDAVLDRESPDIPSTGVIRMQVAARDNGSQYQNDTFIIILIDDVNDNGPMFNISSVALTLPENTPTGFRFYQVQATDKDQPPNNRIIYSIANRFPEGITERIHIDESTGHLSLITTLDYEIERRINFVVRAQDAEFLDRQDELTISINVTDSQSRAQDKEFIDRQDELTISINVTDSQSSLSASIIGGVSGGAASILIVAIVVLCCCIVCICHQPKTTGKLEVDGNGAQLNNQKPILKTVPATNSQQRSVKFSANLGRSTPPTHPPLDIHHDLHSHRQHFSPGQLTELRPHSNAALNAQY